MGCNVVSREEALNQDIVCDPKIGDADYLNCPFETKEEYLAFWEAYEQQSWLRSKNLKKKFFFEACMPIEEMARRGEVYHAPSVH